MEDSTDRPEGEPRAEAVAPDQSALEAAQSMDELRALAARYREEAERNWQQFLHAAADLENYKKQAARQREEAVTRARTSLLAVVLAVLDNLERALEHGESAEPGAILEGIRMTHRQVTDLLSNMGVRHLEAKGRLFDPRYHEAIDVASHTALGVPPNTVVDEIQRGYLLNGEVLRPARVRVAK